MNSVTEKTLIAELDIFRGTNGTDPKFETFNVPFQQGASVLDALIWINDNVDETLSFRYSCINANACKECMMLIDGKVEYACLKNFKKKNRNYSLFLTKNSSKTLSLILCRQKKSSQFKKNTKRPHQI